MKKIICALLIVFSSHVFAQEKLVFSIDLIRHGDRAPGDQIPTSYIYWKEGLGELTEKGINQETQLGKELRIKYIDQYHLLPEFYNANTLYARSTDKDRTIKSADALLLGLYPLNYRKPAGPPPYASRLNFSLWENSDQHYVKVTLNNNPVIIPGCNREPCSLEQFYKIAEMKN